MSRRIVGIADLQTAGFGETLAAIGLGSCVAVAILDRVRRRGALSHVMLPQQSFGRRRPDENMHKYADVAVVAAIQALELVGCRRADMEAKIAGGSHMFDLGWGDQADIGTRNVEEVVRLLAEAGIPLVGSDVGGREGRTVEFIIDTGALIVKTVRGEKRNL